MTIRAKLSALAVGILCVMAIMTGVNYLQCGSVLEGQVKAAGDQAVKDAARTVDEYFGKLEGLTINAAGTVRYAWGNGLAAGESTVESLVASITENNRHLGVQDVYMGFESDGAFADGSGWQEPEDFDSRQRPWYKRAVSSAGTVFTDPYVDAITGRLVITIAMPLYDDGKKLIGVVGMDVDLAYLTEFVRSRTIMGEGNGLLLTGEGMVVASPYDDQIMKVNLASDASIPEGLQKIGKRMLAGETGMALYTYRGVPERVFFTNTRYGFPLAVFFPEKVVTGLVRSLTNVLVLIAGIAVLVIGVAFFFISRSITRPLKQVVMLARRAGEGDLTVTREDFGTEGGGELGQMADAVAAMITAQSETVGKVIEEAGNTLESAQSLAGLSEEANASIGEVKRSVEQVVGISESNSAALEQTNAGVQEVSGSATTTAQSSAEGASASAKTIDISRMAVDRVNSVIEDVRNVSATARANREALTGLTRSVTDISGFVATITGIADQTNLLALNAAIEAARAGDAGRGFAVVADEVRKLAEESNKAAQEVGILMESLQEEANVVIRATDETGTIMDNTVSGAVEAQEQLKSALDQIGRIDDVMQEIAAAAQEQAAAVEQMAASVDQVSMATSEVVEMVTGVGKSAEETVRASEGVAEQAQTLAEGAERLRGFLSRFKVGGDALRDGSGRTL